MSTGVDTIPEPLLYGTLPLSGCPTLWTIGFKNIWLPRRKISLENMSSGHFEVYLRPLVEWAAVLKSLWIGHISPIPIGKGIHVGERVYMADSLEHLLSSSSSSLQRFWQLWDKNSPSHICRQLALTETKPCVLVHTCVIEFPSESQELTKVKLQGL